MSVDVHNTRIEQMALTLPGEDDEFTDDSRGDVSWGLSSEKDQCPTLSVRHPDWASLAASIRSGRIVHDFFFRIEKPEVSCESCAGSGRNKDYAELETGFHRSGGGRWAGWGEGELLQSEVDALVERRRLGSAKAGPITPKNIRRYIVRSGRPLECYEVIKQRAAHLGIDCNRCFDCLGTGLVTEVPNRLVLFMWTFDPGLNDGRIEAAEVRLEDLQDIRDTLALAWESLMSRFGWAIGDVRHPTIRYIRDLKQAPSAPFEKEEWWDDCYHYTSFKEFLSAGFQAGAFFESPIVSYHIFADSGLRIHDHQPGCDLPKEFSLHFVMALPLSATAIKIVIERCTATDGDDLHYMLLKSFRAHERHFTWASGRTSGYARDASPQPNSPYDMLTDAIRH
jgi:hypothetical protein